MELTAPAMFRWAVQGQWTHSRRAAITATISRTPSSHPGAVPSKHATSTAHPPVEGLILLSVPQEMGAAMVQPPCMPQCPREGQEQVAVCVQHSQRARAGAAGTSPPRPHNVGGCKLVWSLQTARGPLKAKEASGSQLIGMWPLHGMLCQGAQPQAESSDCPLQVGLCPVDSRVAWLSLAPVSAKTPRRKGRRACFLTVAPAGWGARMVV